MNIEKELFKIFKNTNTAGPFLFLGSGFSRRYLGLEDWKGLLSKFCIIQDKPFEYYLAKANAKLPRVASFLAKDFNDIWWKTYSKTHIEKFKFQIKDETSALRIEISNYLKSLNISRSLDQFYREELQILKGLNVDGIITTNWDMLIEQLFSDYKVFIGQEELLFSNPQEIGEIYKIHGCASKPESLVLTAEDYEKFHHKNPYLAAKLITLFVEHPIIFMGYSLQDSNIVSLLSDISSCIGVENIEKLRKNLIFIERLHGEDVASISETYTFVGGVQIPIVLVKTDSFIPIYKAINSTKRRIPARILRYCKEQLYEIVRSSSPEKKISVIDINQIEDRDDLEFLVGVGVVSNDSTAVSNIGYLSIEIIDLIHDLLEEDKEYDAQQILKNVIPSVSKTTTNIPVFKYLQKLGINSQQKYDDSIYQLDKIVNRDLSKLVNDSDQKAFFRKYGNVNEVSLNFLITNEDPEKASGWIPLLPIDKINLDILRDFLVQNISYMNSSYSNYSSKFRKLAYLYDRLKWGW